MCAAKDDGIDEWILAHQLVDAFLYKIVGTRAVSLVSFDDGCPQRTSHTAHLDVRMELCYLQAIAVAANGALGSQHTHMT